MSRSVGLVPTMRLDEMQRVEDKAVSSPPALLLKQLVDALLASVADSGMPLVPREAYSIEEAAYVCGLGRATIYIAMQQERLRGRVLNLSDGNGRTGRTLILREDLLAFLRELPEYAPAPRRGTSGQQLQNPSNDHSAGASASGCQRVPASNQETASHDQAV